MKNHVCQNGAKIKAKITGRLSIKRKSHLAKGPKQDCDDLPLAFACEKFGFDEERYCICYHWSKSRYLDEYLSDEFSALRPFHLMQKIWAEFFCPPTVPRSLDDVTRVLSAL